jgi:hypothetical protein
MMEQLFLVWLLDGLVCAQAGQEFEKSGLGRKIAKKIKL